MKRRIAYICSILLLILCIITGCVPQSESADRGAQTGGEVKTESGAEKSGGKAEGKAKEKTGEKTAEKTEEKEADIQESGEYTSKEEVAAYINEFGHLPGNYITKKEAKKLGWVGKQGNLGEVAPGKSIGGDHFGNYEGSLPEEDGREYRECDIDSDGSYRGPKRIIYSDDGFVYYTEDHYESFELLYGEE